MNYVAFTMSFLERPTLPFGWGLGAGGSWWLEVGKDEEEKFTILRRRLLATQGHVFPMMRGPGVRGTAGLHRAAVILSFRRPELR